MKLISIMSVYFYNFFFSFAYYFSKAFRRCACNL